ncbi:hypothetical protein B6N60_02190 [Richelia sinica FACHB-800]|uniref:PEP-CTERM protein-sorting domain-containing protein n=1 Tax=Richelia sinica FACHB-800 TaxID=1357546 RepID=A0A975T7I3_9NOST|nr:NF038130 family PEP-CTERM protein [Richelia sinica]MBD2666182.1 NF038130 family PEP-CTERM protein [Richelia sinica FACHB-800]QXE23500.1 hypothetical protein B6N60_02190 [Richelia sinica FACHB-800]
MKTTVGKLLIGASMAIGVSAIVSTPAQAGSLTGATIGGSASSDYYVYGVLGNNTVLIPSNPANAQSVLDGNAASPTGNVELRASSETVGFDFSKNTTLSGQIGGKNITLSSLVLSDWTSLYKNTGKTFGQYWFDSALTANGFGSLVGTTIGTGFFNAFQANGGFQRFSDPNISYVNQDDSTGLIRIGLAGHSNATPLLLPYYDLYVNSLPNSLLKTAASNLRTSLANSTTKASEIVKYSYNNTTDYLFSFDGTPSGLVASDGFSHNANYEVTIDGIPPEKVPEPSVMLGALGVVGMFAAQRKLKKAAV